eukprot:3518685-Prorocentrum_lima.AAC.1
MECLDRAEEDLIQSTEYKTCSEYGDQQPAYWKTPDFMDMVTDELRFFNVCKARCSTQGTCSLAYPAK